MAEWGKGDERWIVADRDDGRNVNNWHWEDRNVLAKCQRRCEEDGFLIGLEAEAAGLPGPVRVCGVSEVGGEAIVSTRKGGKKFVLFDLKVTLKWTAPASEGDGEIEGEVRVTEFESVNEPDEYEFKVSVTKGGKGDAAARKAAESLRDRVFEKLGDLTAGLLEM